MSIVKNTCKIYVGSIPKDIDEGRIEEMFSDFGKIISLEFKGEFAFIEFADDRSAAQAVKELDDACLNGRRLIVEPFRYRGNDPRYRRPPPPKSVKRGEYRLIVTNLGPSVTAQDLTTWCQNEKLDTLTLANVYSRHDVSKNEGVVEFRDRDDFDYCLRHLDNVKLGDQAVRVFEERDYNRRKLQAHKRDRMYDNHTFHQKLLSHSPNNQLSNDDNNYVYNVTESQYGHSRSLSHQTKSRSRSKSSKSSRSKSKSSRSKSNKSKSNRSKSNSSSSSSHHSHEHHSNHNNKKDRRHNHDKHGSSHHHHRHHHHHHHHNNNHNHSRNHKRHKSRVSNSCSRSRSRSRPRTKK